MGNRSGDPIRGKTFRWTFTNGPTAGKTYEHRFNDNGTVVWRDVKEPAKSKSASEKAKPGADEAPVRYAAFRVADDVYTVSYLALSGYTLTVVLNFKDHRMYGFASNDKQWFPVEGTFEVQG